MKKMKKLISCIFILIIRKELKYLPDTIFQYKSENENENFPLLYLEMVELIGNIIGANKTINNEIERLSVENIWNYETKCRCIYLYILALIEVGCSGLRLSIKFIFLEEKDIKSCFLNVMSFANGFYSQTIENKKYILII